MRINKWYFKILFIAGTLFLASCSDDEPQLPKGVYDNGIIVSGEGSGAGSASVSYISNDYKTAVGKIYEKANGAELGTFLQSITFDGDKAYIIVDNQNTINIVNRVTFEKLGTITTGLEKPRYMTITNGKAYVTNWGKGGFGDNVDDDFVTVIDLNTLAFEKKIPVSVGPERIIANGNKIYVSNKGAYGSNNKVTVIDATDNTIEKELEVNDIPDELYFDQTGALVVVCEGKGSWTGDETKGSITKIKTGDFSMTKIEFEEGDHPGNSYYENNNLYYSVSGKIYKMSLSSTSLPTDEILTPEVTEKQSFYGFSVRNKKIYTLDSSFEGVSKMHIYNEDTKEKIKTINNLALGAAKVYFN